MTPSKIKLCLIVTLMGLGSAAFESATAQAQAQKVPDFLVTTPSIYGFDDTVEILKGAIEQENLMVIHEVDAQKMLRMVEVQTKGMKQILFFHPLDHQRRLPDSKRR